MKSSNSWMSWIVLPLLLSSLTGVPAQNFTFITNDSTLTITGYTGPGRAVTIPRRFNGLPVTFIGDLAFFFNTTVTSVKIPKAVISIGDLAFIGCTSLTNVTLP